MLDEKVLPESYYYIAIYYSYTSGVNAAINYFNLCISLKEKNKENDDRMAKALYNIGVMYYMIGDFKKHEEYCVEESCN